MLRVALVCAVACSTSIPASAGERHVVPHGIKPLPPSIIPVRPATARPVVAREVPHVEKAVVPARTHTVSTFVLPVRERANYDLAAPASQRVAGYASPERTPASPFALPEPRALPAWQLTGRFPEVTARAGARYAVGESLADHRRVGPRRSALDAMLVLRIDGSNDSPPLSLGGGVAGAMWKAGVTR